MLFSLILLIAARRRRTEASLGLPGPDVRPLRPHPVPGDWSAGGYPGLQPRDVLRGPGTS